MNDEEAVVTDTLEERLKVALAETKASIHADFNYVLDKMRADYREQRAAMEASHERASRLIIEGYEKKIRALEDENARLREGLSKSVKIDPYGSIENADARDTARALLYQVPALPVDEEQERSVEALIRRAKAKQAEASTEARRALPWREEP